MDKPRDKEVLKMDDCRQCAEFLENAIMDSEETENEDRFFVRRHSAECSDCSAFNAAIETIREIPNVSDDLAHRAVDEYFGGQRRTRLRPAVIIPIATALAAAAAVLIMFNFTPQESPSSIDDPLVLEVVSGNPGFKDARVSAGAKLAEGDHISTGVESTLVQSGSTLAIGIDEKSRLALDSLSRRRVKLGLKQGRIAVHVAPRNDIELAVETHSARIVVTGTLFSVEASKKDVLVRVVRGSVQVESSLWPNDPVKVVAGSEFSVSKRQQTSLEAGSKREILSLLRIEEAKQKASDEGSLSGEIPAENSEDDRDVDLEPNKPDKQPKEKADSTRGSNARLSKTNTLNIARPEAEHVPSLNELIRSARKCRSGRDWTCAVASYQKVTELYPNHVEASTVLLPLAQIELEHLGQPSRALRHYNLYYKRLPNGPLAQEAMYGICKALSVMGQKPREAEALREFLSRYPRSVYAPNAKMRLMKLSEKRSR
ncbi:MAG: hypothetical protein GY847_10705 [Proteobacteria bacterium]|nr:hypothetical protein [Pseudomonadota bacterium]